MKNRIATMKSNGMLEVLLYEDIGAGGVSADEFIESTTHAGEILVRISSYGGDAFEGLRIYDRLCRLSGHKTVIIDGIAGGISSVIAMAGDRIRMASNAFIMIADPSVYVNGESDDLRNAGHLLDNLKQSAINAYRRHTVGVSDVALFNLMAAGSWLNAKNALALGFADEIIGEFNKVTRTN